MLLLGGSPWSLIIFGLYVLTWSSPVSALGNGKRSTGLSSLAYRFGRFLPGKDAFERSLLDVFQPSASSASASPAAPTPTSVSLRGSIEVRVVSDNTTLGHLSNTAKGLNGLTNNDTEKLSVTLGSSGSSRAPVNIIVQKPNFSGPNNMGGITVSRNASLNLAAGSNNAILLSNVAQTAPGSRPVPTSQGAIASAIWTLDKSTGELKAHWINSNGQSPVTNIILNRKNITLYLMGDPAPVDSDLVPVAFFLV